MFHLAGIGGVDLVAFRRIHPVLRGVLRCRTWFNSLDDHCRTFQPGSQTSRNVGSSVNQLVCQFLRGHRLPNYADNA